mgnify:CR=1 FL=1
MTTQSVLTGEDLRELMEYVLPEDAITELVQAAKFQERTRKRDAVGLIRALVIAASTGYGGRQRRDRQQLPRAGRCRRHARFHEQAGAQALRQPAPHRQAAGAVRLFFPDVVVFMHALMMPLH